MVVENFDLAWWCNGSIFEGLSFAPQPPSSVVYITAQTGVSAATHGNDVGSSLKVFSGHEQKKINIALSHPIILVASDIVSHGVHTNPQ